MSISDIHVLLLSSVISFIVSPTSPSSSRVLYLKVPNCSYLDFTLINLIQVTSAEKFPSERNTVFSLYRRLNLWHLLNDANSTLCFIQCTVERGGNFNGLIIALTCLRSFQRWGASFHPSEGALTLEITFLKALKLSRRLSHGLQIKCGKPSLCGNELL